MLQALSTFSKLEDSLLSLKKVGPSLFVRLKKLTGGRILDVLWHFPLRLEHRPYYTHFKNIPPKSPAAFIIEVIEHYPPSSRKKFTPYKVIGKIGSVFVTLLFFRSRAGYLQQKLPIGQIGRAHV